MILYAAAMVLMLAGIITVITKENLIKKVIGLSVFSNGFFLSFSCRYISAKYEKPLSSGPPL